MRRPSLKYAAVDKENPTLKPDGTHMQSVVLIMLPTSRGMVRLKFCNSKKYVARWLGFLCDQKQGAIICVRASKVQQMFLDTLLDRE